MEDSPAAESDTWGRISATGEQFRFVSCDEDLVRIDWRLPPGEGSPDHVHRHQVERVTAISGALTISWAGGRVVVAPGHSHSVPAGRVHSFENVGRESAHMVVDFIPALQTKRFFETLAGLGDHHRLTSRGTPRDPLILASFAWRFRREFQVTQPPIWIQRLLLPPLAALARRLGRTAGAASDAMPRMEDAQADGLVRSATPI